MKIKCLPIVLVALFAASCTHNNNQNIVSSEESVIQSNKSKSILPITMLHSSSESDIVNASAGSMPNAYCNDYRISKILYSSVDRRSRTTIHTNVIMDFYNNTYTYDKSYNFNEFTDTPHYFNEEQEKTFLDAINRANLLRIDQVYEKEAGYNDCYLQWDLIVYWWDYYHMIYIGNNDYPRDVFSECEIAFDALRQAVEQ